MSCSHQERLNSVRTGAVVTSPTSSSTRMSGFRTCTSATSVTSTSNARLLLHGDVIQPSHSAAQCFQPCKLRKLACRVSALCPARNFRSRSNQTMGCAHMHERTCIRVITVDVTSSVQAENKCCASMACGWCVAQTLLLTRVAKTTSTWRLSALPTAQEVSDQHFEKQFVLALRDPHLLW